MKASSALAVCACLLITGVAFGEPLASWATFVGDSEKTKKLRSFTRGCLPDRQAIAVDIPPDSSVFYVGWVGERPECESAGEVSRQPVALVLLLSRFDAEHVVTWYRNNLADSGYFEYDKANISEVACVGIDPPDRKVVVFMRSNVDSFCWHKHAYRAPMVIVSQAAPLFANEGYKTSIEVSKPSL